MRRRTLVIAAAVALLALIVIGWKLVGGGEDKKEQSGSAASSGEDLPPGARRMSGSGVDPSAPGKVQGIVRDLLDEKAVAGVDVTFANVLGESTATSDAEGRFEIELGAGAYKVQAMGDAVFGAVGSKFKVLPGQQVKGFEVWVSRLARIRGRVIDSGKQPVASARVSFTSQLGGKPIGTAQTVPIGEATTDGSGQFEMEVLPGDVKLVAEAGESRGEALVGIVLPGAEPAEVTIVLAAGAAIAGRVVDNRGAAVPGAEVRATVAGSEVPEKEITADSSGQFRFEHLWPGTIHLEARGAAGVSLPVVVTLADGAEKKGVELVLSPAAAISGRVVDSAGAPVDGARVTAQPGKSRIRPRPATSTGDGTFRIEGLATGVPHKVVARAEGRASRIARDVTPPATDVELVMALPGGIRGVVVASGGRPVDSFQVQVERYVSDADKDIRAGTASSRFTSKDGTFELEVAEPGRYEIVVTAAGHAPLRPPPIAVPAEKWAEVSLELAASAAVTGLVTAGGAPASGVRVAILEGYEGPPVFTDGQGRFKLTDVAPGARSLSASKPGLATAHREVTVKGGANPEVAIEMVAGAGVDGGIGVVLASLHNRVIVKAIGQTARKAGLRRRDLILGIDGVSTLDLSADRAASRLRGPIGSVVRLEVERAGQRVRVDVPRTAE